MKIAIISTPIFKLSNSGGLSNYGGLEQIAWEQAKGLAALGHIVSLIAPDNSECPGVEIIPIGPAGMVDEARAYGGFPDIKEGDIVRRKAHQGYWQHLLEVDCIIDHSWQKFSYQLKMEGKLKAPVLGVCHAPVNTMYQSLPPVEKPCFVCISQDQANHFEALFSKKARVAYNGFNTTLYSPMSIKRTDRFLFVARFSTIKGPDLAIEACKKVGVGLDLIGDTKITNEPDYLKKCIGMCDEKQIRFHGGASRGDCVRWYSQAHCFVHPNMRFREPFGLAPVEANACGLPCIAWDNGAMRETIRDGETGWLVSSMDELVEAINTAKEPIPQEIRNQCRENASRFSVENMAKRYEELIYEAVDGGW